MKQPLQIVLAYRAGLIALAHAALVVGSYLAAAFLRFEFTIPADEAATLYRALPLLIACRLVCFGRYRLFHGWWQYVGVRDILDILKSTTAGSLLFVLLIVLSGAFTGFPRSVVVLEWTLTLHFVAGARVLSRVLHAVAQRMRTTKGHRVLVVGSGPVAESTVRELVETASGREPVGFLDDGSLPRRRQLRGIPRLGRDDELVRILAEQSISEVFIAIPSNERQRLETAIRSCRSAGIPFRAVSSVREHLDRPRSFGIPDLELLLASEESSRHRFDSRDSFTNRNVLVLGAGGQFGSALASRIADAEPRHLLLFDRNESPLYYLELDFLKKPRMVPVTPLIGDVLDEDRLRQILAAYRPEIVIHAAAYTRTDLLAENREEILENNLRGTEMVLRLCDDEDIPRVFLLSCDEDDTSELACMHRASEELLRRSKAHPDRVRAAVRFPSVLGSPRCSATGIARALQANGSGAPASMKARVRVATLAATVPLLLDAFALARPVDVLSLDSGTVHSAIDLVRTLQHFWNLPDARVPALRVTDGHTHAVEPRSPTDHPRIWRRELTPESPSCVLHLLEWLDGRTALEPRKAL